MRSEVYDVEYDVDSGEEVEDRPPQVRSQFNICCHVFSINCPLTGINVGLPRGGGGLGNGHCIGSGSGLIRNFLLNQTQEVFSFVV